MSMGTLGSFQSNPEITHASRKPLFAAIVFMVIGITAIPMAYLLETRVLFLVGYLFTPLSIFGCLIWDSLGQRNGSRDPWFAPKPKVSLSIQVIAVVSLVPAVIQIWNLASWLGEIAVQEGWFS